MTKKIDDVLADMHEMTAQAQRRREHLRWLMDTHVGDVPGWVLQDTQDALRTWDMFMEMSHNVILQIERIRDGSP